MINIEQELTVCQALARPGRDPHRTQSCCSGPAVSQAFCVVPVDMEQTSPRTTRFDKELRTRLGLCTLSDGSPSTQPPALVSLSVLHMEAVNCGHHVSFACSAVFILVLPFSLWASGGLWASRGLCPQALSKPPVPLWNWLCSSAGKWWFHAELSLQWKGWSVRNRGCSFTTSSRAKGCSAHQLLEGPGHWAYLCCCVVQTTLMPWLVGQILDP